jgi:hypothetical protein
MQPVVALASTVVLWHPAATAGQLESRSPGIIVRQPADVLDADKPDERTMRLPAPPAADADRDGDGLSDYQERNKYLTHVDRSDSDGDGKPDGDWNERREFAYSVRVVLRVVPPVCEETLCDDYQDGRVLSRTERYTEIEVILYPFNTNQEAIAENSNWRNDTPAMRPYLAPGPSTNWDDGMRRDLLKALAAEGHDLGRMTDRQAAQTVATWTLKHTRSHSHFNGFHVRFDGDSPSVVPGREQSVLGDRIDPSYSIRDQLEREVLGREMFYHRMRGTCTSSAILLTTTLRAADIPARMILCTPLVDASGGDNLDLVRSGISNHRVRQILIDALEPLRNSNASHTFNEVYVGGRWRRLNYDRLGQNIFDRGCFGLLVHVNTFLDLSTAGLTSWGGRTRDDVFRYENSYTATAVSDAFGPHCNEQNPPAEGRKKLEKLVIRKVRWLSSDDLPAAVRGSKFADDGSGHLFLHAEKPDFDADGDAYRVFYDAVAKDFRLTAEGAPEVSAAAERGYWLNSDQDAREFYVRIPADKLKLMKPGTAYRIEALKQNAAARWEIDAATRVSLPDEKKAEQRGLRFKISKVRWLGDADLPAPVRGSQFAEDGSGHVFLHALDPGQGVGMKELNQAYETAPKRFRLVAKNQDAVTANAERGFWFDREKDCLEFYVRIAPDEMKKLKAGVAYRLEVTDAKDGAIWEIASVATITKK